MTETTKTAPTKSQEIAADVSALLRARNPLLWIVAREEARVEGYLAQAATATRYVPRVWDVAAGIAYADGTPDAAFPDSNGPDAAFAAIRTKAFGEGESQRGLWILRDLPVWLNGPQAARTLRELRNLVRALPTAELDRAQAVVILSPSSDVPPELANHATVIEWPLPDRAEIAGVLDAAIAALPEPLRADAAPNGKREAAIDAAVGLSEEEARACYNRSLVQLKKIDPVIVSKEKRRVIAREKVLEWYDPIPEGLDAVGGLENLKEWLKGRSAAFSPKARAYGLQAPKGTLIVGIPGTGKSLVAKTVSTAWQCPLIRMDLGALKDKFVGGSEANIRKAFSVIDAVGRCVVWLDEIEKSLQGATTGSSDGGASADQLGAILNWMQERRGGAFVIATANDVTSLPPELLRKGRFDEVWSVDLPTTTERASILLAALRANGRTAEKVFASSSVGGAEADVMAVAKACDGFTGSEIASIVPEAMFAAFSDGEREITKDDLLRVAGDLVPLSKTAPDKIAKLREWAKGKARPASPPEAKTNEPRVRALDIA